MPNTYCVQCGAVNQIGDSDCAGCGSYLAAQPKYATPSGRTIAETHEWQALPVSHTALRGIPSFSVGNVLGLTLKLFIKHLWLITRIVFVVVAPIEIFKVMSLAQTQQDWEPTSTMWLLDATYNVLIAPALIYALMKIRETGVAPGVNESFRWGLTKIGRLAVCVVLSWVLQALGYMLCIIPGIIVSLSLALVYPVAILEKGSPSDVLKRSNELTRGHRWEILAMELVLGLLGLQVIGFLFFLIGNISEAPPVEVFAVPMIIKDIAMQAFTVLSLVMYLTLIRTPTQGHTTLNLTN